MAVYSPSSAGTPDVAAASGNSYRQSTTYYHHPTYPAMQPIPGVPYATAVPAPLPSSAGHGHQYNYAAPPPHVPAAPAFFPLYTPGPAPAPAPVHHEPSPYYYYSNAYPMFGGYAVSPPGTPPAQIPVPYLVPHGHPESKLPPTPPQMPAIMHSSVPSLEMRRSSWSSSENSNTPGTPFMRGSAAPTIVDSSEHGSFQQSKTYGGGKNIESMLLAGPPIPRPIPTVYSQESVKDMGQILENPTGTTNVYVRGLPPDTNDDKLLEMTCRFGVVSSHKAIMDNDQNTCKGYGFARFETINEAENCIRGLVSQNYEAGFARESFNARLKDLGDPNSTNVYVSNLPRSMNEKDMQDIFAGYHVVSNRVLKDANGLSRGVGFCRFESRDVCDEIIRHYHGHPVGPERLPLQVRYADTSAQKRLKASTIKKRMWRTSEYNRMAEFYSNGFPSGPRHGLGNQSQYKSRVWARQSSMVSNMSNDSGVTLPTSSQESPRSQEIDDFLKENRPATTTGFPHTINRGWRTGSMGAGTTDILETVHEFDDRDDASIISETQSETTTRAYGNGFSTKSTGSYSEPGDSYGGREYDNIIVY